MNEMNEIWTIHLLPLCMQLVDLWNSGMQGRMWVLLMLTFAGIAGVYALAYFPRVMVSGVVSLGLLYLCGVML